MKERKEMGKKRVSAGAWDGEKNLLKHRRGN